MDLSKWVELVPPYFQAAAFEVNVSASAANPSATNHAKVPDK